MHICKEMWMQSPVWAGFMKVSCDCATAMTFDFFMELDKDLTDGAVFETRLNINTKTNIDVDLQCNPFIFN